MSNDNKKKAAKISSDLLPVTLSGKNTGGLGYFNVWIGIASLMIEMLQAADAYDVSEEVVSSIAKSMDNIPFTSHLDRLVTGTAIHCHRRAAELKGSIAMLEECGFSSVMTKAAKERMEDMEQFDFAARYVEKKPDGWNEIIQVMKEEK